MHPVSALGAPPDEGALGQLPEGARPGLQTELGISHKNEVEEMGVAAFNDACRTSVLRYTDEWVDYVTRQARWVDVSHD